MPAAIGDGAGRDWDSSDDVGCQPSAWARVQNRIAGEKQFHTQRPCRFDDGGTVTAVWKGHGGAGAIAQFSTQGRPGLAKIANRIGQHGQGKVAGTMASDTDARPLQGA